MDHFSKWKSIGAAPVVDKAELKKEWTCAERWQSSVCKQTGYMGDENPRQSGVCEAITEHTPQ